MALNTAEHVANAASFFQGNYHPPRPRAGQPENGPRNHLHPSQFRALRGAAGAGEEAAAGGAEAGAGEVLGDLALAALL